MRYTKLEKFQREFLHEMLEVFNCKNLTELGKKLNLLDPSPYEAMITRFEGKEKDKYLLSLLDLTKNYNQRILYLERELKDLHHIKDDLSEIDNLLTQIAK